MDYKNTALYQKALNYASEAHKNQFRKGSDIPYITHPVEVADIIASFTDDEEMIATGLLHDVVEDTDRTEEDIRACFGDRIADMVAAETEDKMRDRRAEDTWVLRRSSSIGPTSRWRMSSPRRSGGRGLANLCPGTRSILSVR